MLHVQVLSCVVLKSAPTYFGDSAGNESQAIMVGLSNPSIMTSHDKIFEEYKQEYSITVRSIILPYTTEQGFVKIKEWLPPSTIDILMEMQS